MQHIYSRCKTNFLFALPFTLMGMLTVVLLLLLLFSVQTGRAESGPGNGGGDSSGREERFRGYLVIAPLNGIGTWVIATAPGVSVTVLADAQTRLDDGVPPVGVWIEVRANQQNGGGLLATRIRRHDSEPGQIVARLVDGVAPATITSRYQISLLNTLLSSGNIYLFTIDEDQAEDNQAIIARMKNDGEIRWAELNFASRMPEGSLYKTWRWGGNDENDYVNQAAFAQVNLAPALQQADGTGVVIAVLDTGIDLNHPGLAGKLAAGWDMVADDASAQDEGPGFGWGHGTHVAGIIAHIAPASQLMPVRVLDSNGHGNTFILAYAIEWAATQGADVINLSLGAEDESQVLKEVIERVSGQGVIIVAAAGNANSNTPQIPAVYPGVIAVTAVDAANHKADFANYGIDWVDVAAPGVGITSTLINEQGSGYASWSGTSMATGFASGAAALLRQRFMTETSASLVARIISTTGDLDAANPGFAGQLGGLLDIGAAVSVAATPTVPVTPVATPQPTVIPPITPESTATPVPTGTSTVLVTPTPLVTDLPNATPTPGYRSYLPLVSTR